MQAERPGSSDLSVVTSLVGGVRWVTAAGALDLDTVPLLEAATVGSAEPGSGSMALLLDLSRVTFLDFAGLAALQRVDRLLRRRGLGLVVDPPVAPGPVRLLLLAVGMGLIGPVFGADPRRS